MKNIDAVALGRLGGLKGGKARALKLSKERRIEIAKYAAQKRWNKSSVNSLNVENKNSLILEELQKEEIRIKFKIEELQKDINALKRVITLYESKFNYTPVTLSHAEICNLVIPLK